MFGPIAPLSRCTGEEGKGKRGRTASDDAGGKSLSETSKSNDCRSYCETGGG